MTIDELIASVRESSAAAEQATRDLQAVYDQLATGATVLERPTVTEIAERSGVPVDIVRKVVEAIGHRIATP